MFNTSDRDDSEPSFENYPVSRRQFVRLSAATAGALSFSGTALADHSSSKSTDLYEFIVNHVPSDYEIPTLIELSDTAGFDELVAHDLDPITTTTPTIAAYVSLTPSEVDEIVQIDSVSTLRYSPGSNPFWRLGYYPNGVFPDADDSVDFIDFEQMIDGMRHLQSQYESQMRIRSAGKSHGHYNLFRGEADPQNIWAIEVTNDVDDTASFEDKEKVLFSLSIHGDERSGAEAGSRFIEQVLVGDEPQTEALLDDVVLVFLYPNPDGWVARDQQYRVDLNGDGEPEHNSFKRVTGTGIDPNRQYPTVGWIDSHHFPAEPDGTNLVDDQPGVDADVPSRYTETVPDALDIVEFCRDYKNLRIGSDLHGKFWSPEFIDGLIVNDQYDTAEFHDLYEWNRRVKARIENALGDKLAAAENKFRSLNEAYGNEWGFDGSQLPTPKDSYNYGTILDTIDYTTTGALISWMSQPEDQGGLGIQMMAHEMGWDNRVFDRETFRPWLVDLQVTGYLAVIRETIQHALRTVTATIETDGQSTAYVTTDALTRTSAALSFSDADTRTVTRHLTAGSAPETVSIEMPESAQPASISLIASGMIHAHLRDPTGRVVKTYNAAASNTRSKDPEWTLREPETGKWTVDIKTVGGTKEAAVTVRHSVTVDDGDDTITAPNPIDVLGYEQRPYRVTPLSYFPDYAQYTDRSNWRGHWGKHHHHHNGNHSHRHHRHNQHNGDRHHNHDVAGVAIDNIANGALFRGRSHQLAVDNLVITHAQGHSNDRYVTALDRFLEAGGNLVLTDRGVSLLGVLENDLVDGISADDIAEIEIVSASLSERVDDHPLLSDTRPIQRELWKPAPLGYPISTPGTAPLTVIDPTVFESAGGSVAGYTSDDSSEGNNGPFVSAGTLANGNGAVHVIGGLLPPAHQPSLHPFGMLEYTATFLGHTMLTNALGYTQVRYVDGEPVATFGSKQ